METGIMLLKAKNDKAGMRQLAYQVAQITTRAVKTNVEIVDCIVSYGSSKDFVREITKLDKERRFDCILIYSPSQICKDKVEYMAFQEVLEKEFKVKIHFVRSIF